MNNEVTPQDLLDQMKNLALSYNTKVTPRRQIAISKQFTNINQMLIM